MSKTVSLHRRDQPFWSRWAMGIAIAIIMALGLTALIAHLLSDPRVVLLLPEDGAEWIKPDEPFDSSARFDPLTATEFAVPFIAPPGFAGASLRVTALRRVVVRCDQRALFDSSPDLDRWKTVYTVPLPADLIAGHHILTFAVSNTGGPSLLRADCPELNLKTHENWLASTDGLHWKPAALADRPIHVTLPPQFHSTTYDLVRLSPLLIVVFAVGFALLCRRESTSDWGWRVRWVILIAWCILALNNIMKFPLEYGYDADQQTRYIQYVADHRALPRPDGGWQFFQAPLYYIVSAALQRLLLFIGVASSTVPYLLRAIPLLCGGLIIEICYQAARIVFPARFDLQAITTTVGGVLPVNIYMAQAVSNEPLGAVMSGLILLFSLRFLKAPQTVLSAKAMLFAGVIIGVALLTKVNTLIWCLPVGAVIAFALHQTGASTVQSLRAIGTMIAAALVVCGWFLVRNVLLIGRPFYLESSVTRSQWWQDPGYRTPRMFYEFGDVFTQPIYNGLNSIWDSLYGTLWTNGIVAGRIEGNFGLMSCGLWLALVPMLAILIGIWRALATRNASLLFAAGSLVCFILAIGYVYLTLPIYSCAKASYMLGTAPCIGLLAAAGFDQLMKKRLPRAVAGGAIVCWAVTAYLAYFAI